MSIFDALEDFAGPGGWDEGAKLLGLRFAGFDYDKSACETAQAAGHHREQVDVTEHETPGWALRTTRTTPIGHVSSPSCTLFSMAGSGIGRLVINILCDAVKSILGGSDPAAVRDVTQGAIYPVALAEAEAKNAKRKTEKRWPQEKVEAKARLDAKVAALVLEPARRIVEMEPEWVALEQVPEVLPVWHAFQVVLSNQGWSVWVGVMNAADYGVPQTRRRAILIASRVREVSPPEPTHAEHPQGPDLFGTALKPWVCMADALGWGWEEEPSCTVTSGGGGAGGPEIFANAGYRSRLREYVVDRRTNSKAAGGGMAPTVPVPVTRPAPTLTGKAGHQWVLRPDQKWAAERPATTVVGSFKPEVIAAPGYRTDISRQDAPGSVSVSVSEAGVLQSFRDDYPWQGSKGKQFEQVGNAIPPLLAAHVLSAATGIALDSEVAA